VNNNSAFPFKKLSVFATFQHLTVLSSEADSKSSPVDEKSILFTGP